MAIALNKTLQAVEYNLYIISTIHLVNMQTPFISVSQDIYQSIGHYNDGFIAIIHRDVDITDSAATIAITALLGGNYPAAVTAAEQYLINTHAYYSGGSIVG